MSEQGAGKRATGSFIAWAHDWFIDHWPQIVTVVLGGGGMSYLAAVSEFLKPYAPLSWGAVGILAALLLSAVYALYGYAKHRLALAGFSDDKRHLAQVNPLDDLFTKRRINLVDFYHPFYQSHKNRKFQDCEVYGPAAIYFIGCRFEIGVFSQSEAVIIREGALMVGVTAFENCTFERCKFFRITLLLTKSQFLDFKAQGVILPVVSDGKAGDL